MQVHAATSRFKPVTEVRCSACGSRDVLPMPVVSLVDRLAWIVDRAPFKCRKCHAKLFRRIVKVETG